MKTNLHISLNSSQNEKCFRQIMYRKSKHIFYVQYFFRKSCRLRDNVEKILYSRKCRRWQ